MTQQARGDSDSIGGEALISYNRRPQTFRAGRKCRFDGCSTLLSIYNSGEFCAAHDGCPAGPLFGPDGKETTSLTDWASRQAG
jgi:hypothetical protein